MKHLVALTYCPTGIGHIYVGAPPVEALNNAMNTWLNGMRARTPCSSA